MLVSKCSWIENCDLGVFVFFLQEGGATYGEMEAGEQFFCIFKNPNKKTLLLHVIIIYLKILMARRIIHSEQISRIKKKKQKFWVFLANPGSWLLCGFSCSGYKPGSRPVSISVSDRVRVLFVTECIKVYA